MTATNHPAVVLLVHDKPRHLRRLVDALAPLPVFLHVDATVPEAGYRELVRDLPKRVRVLPRLEAGWGRFELVEAELSGYRAALKETAAQHLIMMSGADYPRASVVDPGRGAVKIPPGTCWPRSTRFRSVTGGRWAATTGSGSGNAPWRRRRLVLPVPRRVPAELDPAGGSQMKILSRDRR